VGKLNKGAKGSLDGVTSLPDHTDDGARVHVADETGEEGLGREVGVVLLEVVLAGGSHLQADELESEQGKARESASTRDL
jgi:hypothetical protein